MNCIFCMIKDGIIPSKKVYEDENVIAILDISSATLGHTLVIPKKHYEDIFSIPQAEYLKVMSVVHMLASKIVNNLGAEGCNIINNNGEVAGQTVKHYHVHIIPRYKDDDFKIISVDHSKDVNLDQVLEKLL